MSESYELERNYLSQELAQLRAMVRGSDRKIDFWIESVRFCISELEIWNAQRNTEKCEVAIERARNCLDRLRELLDHQAP